VSAIGLSKAKATAMAVIEGLEKHDLRATPVNYAVWYAHMGGENPTLTRRISDHLSQSDELTDEVLEELWRRHCSPSGDPMVVAQASDRLGRLMAGLAQHMSSAGSQTESFGEAITRFGEGIVEAMGSPDMATILRDATKTMLVETRRMAEQNRALEGQLKDAGGEIASLRSDLEEMRREAYTDQLTGVGNRKTFDRAIINAMTQARDSAKPLSLIMIDIDFFKKFNDSHGHLLGDEVLKLVARSLVSGVKGRDTVARYGGEEFGIILPETSLSNAYRVADQLRDLVKNKRITIKSTGKDLGRVTLSLGVSLYRPGEAATSLIKRADAALYFAKRNGRDRVADENDVKETEAEAAA
jgi:diguanylate cyclase